MTFSALDVDHDAWEREDGALRVKIVRDALHALALDPKVTRDEARHFGNLSYHITDVTAARLGRMLR